jgi:hypothetical protein
MERMQEYPIPLGFACEIRVESLIEEAASRAGLQATMKSTLAEYPGCIHWHFKRGVERGVLEATYWPRAGRAWLSTRPGREAWWIPSAVDSILAFMAEACV